MPSQAPEEEKGSKSSCTNVTPSTEHGVPQLIWAAPRAPNTFSHSSHGVMDVSGWCEGREDSNSSFPLQYPTGSSPGSCSGASSPLPWPQVLITPQPPFYQSISPNPGVQEGFWNKSDWLGPRKHLSKWWMRPALGEKKERQDFSWKAQLEPGTSQEQCVRTSSYPRSVLI